MFDPHRIGQIRADFPAADRMSYMNTGTIGIMPECVLQRLMDYIRWYNDRGPALPSIRENRTERLEAAHATLQSFFGATEDEIQFVTDTTAGMNAIISSLPLVEGDEVLVSDIEHYAGRVPWAYAAKRIGLKVRVVPSRAGVVQLDDIDAAVNERTRVISISHVSFTTGGRCDIPAIGAYARERGIFLLVDGAQSAGALDLDLGELDCDAFAFPGYKWCLGPEGSGALYINSRVHDELDPPTIALGATSERDLDGDYRLRRGARLYAPSTQGVMQPVALGYSLEYLQHLGMEQVESHIEALTSHLIGRLEELPGVEVITPRQFSHRAGLVSFRVPELDQQKMKSAVEAFLTLNLHIRVVPSPLAFRTSLHIYNDEQDISRLIELLHERLL